MKSITACPHCSIQFLVEDEQLGLYNGKVRCGNCLNVFNAVDYMVPSIPNPSSELEENIVSQITDTPASEEKVINGKSEENLIQDTETAPVDIESSSEKTVNVEETDAESNPEQQLIIEDNAADHVQLEKTYIEKTQSLIQHIDMHNISTQVDSNPEINHIELVDSEYQIEHDEELYIPNLPSREELSDVVKAKQDSVDDYSVYDLPIEPSFTLDIDEALNDEETHVPKTIIDADKTPVFQISDNRQQDAVQAPDEDALYIEEKTETSPLLIVLSVLFIVLIFGQIVYFARNHIATAYPSTKPYLKQTCQLFGCTIELPKEIQLFSIDDSGIQEDAEYQGVIRLSSTLTNRADFNQAYPNLEVTLTDTQDQPKIRRIFKPEEYLPREVNLDSGIAPGDAVSIDMPLMTDDVKVSGFRILLTY